MTRVSLVIQAVIESYDEEGALAQRLAAFENPVEIVATKAGPIQAALAKLQEQVAVWLPADPADDGVQGLA